MKGSRMSLPTQMAIGMVLGVAAGALTPAMGLDPHGTSRRPIVHQSGAHGRGAARADHLVAGAASVGDVSKLGA